MKKRFISCFIFFFLFIFSLFARKTSASNRIKLSENWAYSIRGANGPFYLTDNNELNKLALLIPSGEGYIWLKSRFYIPKEYQDTNLTVYLGVVKIASEAYLNGKYIGQNGYFPPKPFSTGELGCAFNLPSTFLNYGQVENELIIKIWVSGYGTISDEPFIAPQEEVTYYKAQNDLLRSKFFLMLSVVLLIISTIYTLLYIFRSSEKRHRSFAGITFFSSFFLVTLCIGEYPIIYKQGFSYLLYEVLFHGIAGSLSSHCTVSFIRDFLHKKDSPKIVIMRVCMTLFNVILVSFSHDIPSFLRFLQISYLVTAIHILYGVRYIIQGIIEKNKNVLYLLTCFSPVFLSLFVALFFYFSPSNVYALIIVASGWMLTILSFLGFLIRNLAKSQTQAEYLNKNLETIVEKRTYELEQTNAQLESKNLQLQYEKDRTQKEIELASFVQQSFYNQTVPQLDNWEIATYMKPLAGVSGDLYDIFYTGNHLNGLGIFDVSGHGISSGLVTMLVKNIIEQEFNDGSKEKLEDVMYIINDRLIEEKGNIENYMTGILLRLKDNNIEFVNAGHPSILIFRDSDNEPQIMPRDKSQCGVIGISDFPINFHSTNLFINRNDTLLFYTDGIIEATNENDEQFGTKRLLESFKKCRNLPLNAQINSIIADLKLFIGAKALNDDITIMMLRRK